MAPAPGPVTVVTGSSRGIGFAVAEALAADGHRLVLVARNEDRLQEAAASLLATGAKVATYATDLQHEGAADDVIRATEKHFGHPDVIVNNAGTAPSDKIESTSAESVAEAFALHVAAPLAFARVCAASMKQRRSGCFLQLASTAGLRGYPFTAAYTAAKHGMVGLTRALHAELAPKGIQAYAVCPGFVDSDITRAAAAAIAARGKTSADEALSLMGQQNRIARMHTCEEVAAAVASLLRDRPAGCVYELDRDPAGFID